jgi:integrase
VRRVVEGSCWTVCPECDGEEWSWNYVPCGCIFGVVEAWPPGHPAARTWGSDGYGLVWRALVLWQAFVGTRPAEAYGLVRADLDVAAAEVDVRRQRTPFTPRDATPDELPLPKNGKTRRVVIPPPALEAIQALPRPLDPAAPLFGTRRGRVEPSLKPIRSV